MKNIKKLTILHSNDLHGDFLAERIDERLVGGVAYLSGYINKVREEEKNVIYAIAGDMFRGSVIDSEYKGISTIEIMNALAPDVVSIGNNEVDYGIAHLLFIEKCAKFPIVNANMYIKTNGARLFNPYKIIEIDGMKILLIGIVTEEILASAKSEGLIGSIIDTVDAAKEIGRICNAHNGIDIDFTVLLTHIGFEEDKKLAQLLDPQWGVDVIIGGHSHTFLDEPVVINGIPIVQAGMGTDGIGRFDIDVDTDNNCIDTYKWQYVPIDNTTCRKDIILENIIHNYKSETDLKYGKIVTKFKHQLTHPQRNQETTLGNLVADIMKQSLGLDVMLFGSGSIRLEKLGPTVTLGALNECFPYHDKVHMLKIKKDQLRHMLKYICREETWMGDHTEFYQLSYGMHGIYSKSKKDFLKIEYEGKDLHGDELLKVGLQNFHFNNFEQLFGLSLNEILLNGDSKVISTNDFDNIYEYLAANNIIDSQIENRLLVVD